MSKATHKLDISASSSQDNIICDDIISCPSCGFSDSLEASSNSGSSSHSGYYLHNNISNNNSSNNKGSKVNASSKTKHEFAESGGLVAYRRSESCSDVNGNSRTRTNTSKRKIPMLSALSVMKNIPTGKGFSASLDTGGAGGLRQDRIHDARDCTAKANPVHYLTPLQRKEREGKEMKKEISRLYQELSGKDELIIQLKLQLDEQAKAIQEGVDDKVSEIQRLLEGREKLVEEMRQKKSALQEELTTMDQMFTDLKVKQKLQEDQFQERYLEMYKSGHKAALFEREQELEMMASVKQPKVGIGELTRKLSKTESELAKWQTLILDETYKSAEKPETDADVTLSFLKDSFYHFICDDHDCLRHFRAIVSILRYPDPQMDNIRRAVSQSKEFARMFKKDTA